MAAGYSLARRQRGSQLIRVLFGLLLFGAAFVQVSLSPELRVLDVVPNVALVFLLVWSASRGVEEGLVWAFALGLWFDFLTLDRLGTSSLALLVVALVGAAVHGRFFRSGAILPIVAVFVATVGHALVGEVVGAVGGEEFNVGATLRISVLTGLLNMLIVPVIYLVTLFMERWIPGRVS